LCFFFRMRLRRFLISDPMSGAQPSSGGSGTRIRTWTYSIQSAACCHYTIPDRPDHRTDDLAMHHQGPDQR
jgi:hypothetical protein